MIEGQGGNDTMPRFTIYEERIEIYSATIEAESWEHAKELYLDDDEEIFGNMWEQEETKEVELTHIVELDENGLTKTTHIFEDGELQDSIMVDP
jgi:hypothetical protein